MSSCTNLGTLQEQQLHTSPGLSGVWCRDGGLGELGKEVMNSVTLNVWYRQVILTYIMDAETEDYET